MEDSMETRINSWDARAESQQKMSQIKLTTKILLMLL
jgi:hypothetical protein